MALQLTKVLPYAISGWIPGGRRHCVLCGRRVWRFMPYRNGSRSVAPLMHALEVVGSDVDNFECPRCGAHDRERHLLLYLRASGMLKWMKDRSILHFAPEKRLPRWIQAAGPADYTACDLCPLSPHVRRVDMLDMDIASASVDMVIANHVLEHVDDVDRASSEIFRVLKPGGYSILQTPYSAKLQHTWSDEGIDTPQARLQAYGQEDHVRLFGRDVFERIEAAGFESRVRQHDDLLGDTDPSLAGVNRAEPFFLYRKPA
ncbi:class I SAM-dependent methyltransferase [Luteimonas deserti]|uniref:Class I SAM-dependent methyltransferase n=1 Tax=Luteimonas deserti TaxID=2752306 RepID=A0A7Z0TW14_9GAMM|nr:class I SAM-dependent methyltransferase [Luteimonas deserti]NYZ62824.1 class I SAM-dependent methyltransferase [Luteimonas deserti]